MEPLRPDEPSAAWSAPELTALSAHRIATLVAAGDVRAEEVVAAQLQHIAAIDPVLHAMVQVDGEHALAAGARTDRRRGRGHRLGPLAGVPFVVKDNIDVRRQTTSSGSRAHTGAPAVRDAPAVARLRQAGAILLGRANMDELAMGASTQTSAFGATRNPWDRRRSPGGSSGGCAAAVAAGLAALSVGTDTGGSIREPAAQCGVVGMAPSPGLVPLDGVVPFAPELDRVGPLARSISDAAQLLAVMAATADLAALRPDAVRGLRIGVVNELAGPINHAGVRAGLDIVRCVLTELGADVVTVSMPDSSSALSAYMTITSAAGVALLEPYVRTGRAGAEVLRRWGIGRSLRHDGAADIAAAYATRARLVAQAAAALERCDVLLSPTMPTTAPLLATETADCADVSAVELADPMAAPYTDCWTVVANLAGLPAVSLPAGRSAADGMPVGVMLSARAGADRLLLEAAAALEGAGVTDRG